MAAAVLCRAFAGRADARPPVELGEEQPHPSGAYSYRIPVGWTAAKAADDPDAIDAVSPEGISVRMVYRRGEVGYDALHGLCMAQRPYEPRDAIPRVEYEYDYVEGHEGVRRTLDSAFVAEYETPIQGHRKWRQRNLTMVGGGHSLCVITFAPVPVWKKSGAGRDGEKALLASLKFR